MPKSKLDCFVKNGRSDLQDDFDSLVENGMDEIEAANSIINAEHKDIVDQLNAVKEQVGLSPDSYSAPDNTDKIKEVNEKYNKIEEDKKKKEEEKKKQAESRKAKAAEKKKTKKPTVKLTPDIQSVMEEFGVNAIIASEIDKAEKESETEAEYISRIDAINKKYGIEGRSSEASDGDLQKQITSLDLSGVSEQQAKEIGITVINAGVAERKEMAQAMTHDLVAGRGKLLAGGDVVFQAAPNLLTKEQQSTKKNIAEAIHEIGFGELSEGSLYEILTGENYTEEQRGMAAAYIAALRLLDSTGENFIGKLFGKAAANKNNFGKIRIVYDTSANSAILAANTNGYVYINAYKLGKRLSEFGGETRFLNWMEHALQEEVIHLVTYRVAEEKEIEALGKSLTKDEVDAVNDLYDTQHREKNKRRKLSDFDLGNEYLRMIMQEKLFGVSTELFKAKMAGNSKARNIFAKILAYIKNAFIAKPSDAAAEIIGRMEAFIKGTDINEILDKAERIEKPKIRVHEKPDFEYPVLIFKNTFLQRKDLASGTAYFEVKKMDDHWEPISNEPLGYSEAEVLKNINDKEKVIPAPPVFKQENERILNKREPETVDRSKLGPIEYADMLEAMTPAERDEVDYDENPYGYDYFEARRLMPRVENSTKFKKVGDGDGLFDYEYLANVNGVPYGLVKDEDPDEPDKAFIWTFTNLEDAAAVDNSVQSFTSDNDEIMKEMIADMKARMGQQSEASGEGAGFNEKARDYWQKKRARTGGNSFNFFKNRVIKDSGVIGEQLTKETIEVGTGKKVQSPLLYDIKTLDGMMENGLKWVADARQEFSSSPIEYAQVMFNDLKAITGDVVVKAVGMVTLLNSIDTDLSQRRITPGQREILKSIRKQLVEEIATNSRDGSLVLNAQRLIYKLYHGEYKWTDSTETIVGKSAQDTSEIVSSKLREEQSEVSEVAREERRRNRNKDVPEDATVKKEKKKASAKTIAKLKKESASKRELIVQLYNDIRDIANNIDCGKKRK